jgi:hypothetical protein
LGLKLVIKDGNIALTDGMHMLLISIVTEEKPLLNGKGKIVSTRC